MKKLFAAVLALSLLMSLTAAASAAPVRVGIVQLVENGAFTDMREGFIARLKELGYTDDTLTTDYMNAQGDMSTLNSICQTMADNKVDVVVTIATPATQAMVNLQSGIPVFFISVANPVGAGVITDMAKPDKNATGTSNAIPVGDIFALAAKLTPDAKKFGILYNNGEVNAVTTAGKVKEYCEANGLTYEEAVVTASSEVQQAAQSLVDRGVQAFYIPNDSMIQSAMPLVSEVAKQAKIPSYGSSATTVQSGAFATIAIDDREIGARTADMLDQFLKGAKIEDIPAQVLPATQTVINKTTADAIGLTVPEDVLATAKIVE